MLLLSSIPSSWFYHAMPLRLGKKLIEAVLSFGVCRYHKPVLVTPPISILGLRHQIRLASLNPSMVPQITY